VAFSGVGLALMHVTPIPMLMAPVFILGAVVYLVMAMKTHHR